jgi:hypothetical protein
VAGEHSHKLMQKVAQPPGHSPQTTANGQVRTSFRAFLEKTDDCARASDGDTHDDALCGQNQGIA